MKKNDKIQTDDNQTARKYSGGMQKSSGAPSKFDEKPTYSNFKPRTNKYTNEGKRGFEEFVISPIPNESGRVEQASLSTQAQEFLDSGKNRIQINNQSDDVGSINLIPDAEIDYKNIELLKKYITQFGQIKPMYSMGIRVNTKKRRLLALAIKKARFLGLISYPDQVV